MPTYIRQLKRGGWQLQRAVPQRLRGVAGKAIWSAPGGGTRHEAQRRLSAFLQQTDAEIRRLSDLVTRELGPEELTDHLPEMFDLKDQELVEALEEGAQVALAEGWMTRNQADRYRRVLHGAEPPQEHLTAAQLVAMAAALKSPSSQTVLAWRSCLNALLDHARVVHPTAITREHALAFREHLLRLVSPATAKTRLAYLSGLWSVLAESRGMETHAFSGVAKRIVVKRKTKVMEEVRRPEDPLLQVLYFTGCRLAEAAGLRREDILEDRILIRPHPKRPLKTAASEREIPLHPELAEVVAGLPKRKGLVWPEQFSQASGRWGAGLHGRCMREAGVSPKGLRDRAATVLRSAGLNEAVAARLLGHTPSWMTASYSAVPWESLAEAVRLL